VFAIPALDRDERDERGEVAIASAGAGGGGLQLRAIAGGNFEASGVAHVAGTDRFLFVDDGKEEEIFLMRLRPDGSQLGDATAVPIAADVTDPEGITSDGRYFYLVGSQSKRTGFEGDGLVRFTFDTVANRISAVERIQGLKAWLAANVPELRGTADRVGDEVLNIEGLAWDPRAHRLLLALRAPVDGEHALVIPVGFRDSAGPFTVNNIRLDSAAIRIPLGGAGLRAIEHDSVTNSFMVVTGAALNDETRDFRVFEWDGTPGSTPRELRTFPRALKPEGITRANLGGRPVRVVVFDVGSFVVLP
ncbi:MAG: DUF3616 domain-containing protein, partial [Gemmatimonadaceae bacterium]